MVPGVRASIGVARSPAEVRADLDQTGWPWLGRPGPLTTREVILEGRPPRSFCLRVFTTVGVGREGPIWRLQLAEPRSQPARDPVVEAQLSLEPVHGSGTRLHLSGRFARGLAEMGSAVPISVSRLAANALARALLEQIAAIIESRPASVAAPGQPAPAAGPVGNPIRKNGRRAARTATATVGGPTRANGRPSVQSRREADRA